MVEIIAMAADDELQEATVACDPISASCTLI
jgi:hypothetical protein